MTTTNGNIIVENIKVGDIHYEFAYGCGIKCEVINTLNNIPDSRVAQGIELFWIESKRYLNTL